MAVQSLALPWSLNGVRPLPYDATEAGPSADVREFRGFRLLLHSQSDHRIGDLGKLCPESAQILALFDNVPAQ